MNSKIRINPRFSVNKLAEYLTTTAGRRERLLRDQKFPKDFMTTYYKDGADAICEYVQSNFDESIYEAELSKLGEKPTTGTIQQDKRIGDCIDALERFESVAQKLQQDLEAFLIRKAPSAPKDGTINVEGVEVSLRPEFFIIGKNKKGDEVKGAIKFYLSKNNPLSPQSANAIGALTTEFLISKSDLSGATKKEFVLVIDVFAQKIYPAPKATKKIMDEITAACREIAGRWSQIKP